MCNYNFNLMPSNDRPYSFIVTKNNPKETLQEFYDTTIRILDPKWLVVQLERGEKTLHFQAAFGFKHGKSLKSILSKMVGCHVEVARNAAHVAAYCHKSNTRVEGPLVHGKPPLRRNTKDGHAELNNRCLKEGVEALIQDGTISFREYIKIKRGVEIYQQTVACPEANAELLNEWHYGPSGSGKSSWVRRVHGQSLFNKAINKWFDGYAG